MSPWIVVYAGNHPDPEKRNRMACERCGEMALAPLGARISTFVAITEAFAKIHDGCEAEGDGC